MEWEFDGNMMCVLGTLLPGYRKVSGPYTGPLQFPNVMFSNIWAQAVHCKHGDSGIYVWVCVGSILTGYRNVSIGSPPVMISRAIFARIR